MSKKRRQHSAQYKFQVAMEAAKGNKTLSELSSENWGPPQSDQQLETTTALRWRRSLSAQRKRQRTGASSTGGGTVRANRPAEDGTGVVEKKDRSLPVKPNGR